jgi:2-(1,2-epoxy-1,2-dihydrophenyl)acetyl-CoA isomerase
MRNPEDATMNETVLYQAEGGIATITLNRPERLNAMTAELLEGALDALEQAAGDPAVRVVIFTGAGRGFCAGADLTARNILGEGGYESRVRLLRSYVRTAQLLREMPKPTIAAVNGAAAGAGAAWAYAADLRYAAASAKFVSAYVNVGLSGDFGGTWTLPRIVGAARARQIFLLNEPLSASEAERLGLVSKALPDAELLPYVRSVAERLLGFSPTAVRNIKANLNDADTMSFTELLDRETERHIRSGETDDAREARSAFLEKRKPEFAGR